MMKKILVLFALLVSIAMGASAQKGDMAVGGSLGYGSEIESLGIGARFQYNIMENLRLSPDIMFFFPKDHVTAWETNLNAHYLFPIVKDWKIYPIGGLIITGWSFDKKYYSGSTSETRFGLNLGGGVQYHLTSNLLLNGELKYGIVSDIDQVVISSGIVYKF